MTDPFIGALSVGQIVSVTPTSFNHNVDFVTYQSGTTDQISARAFDGILWSDWHTINITSQA